ncbi:MAG: hypothetical protein AAF512_11295, partial [Pseudomonadota bacterium]
EPIPCSLFLPEQESSGVVLMGHGLGVDRYHISMQIPIQILTKKYGISVIAPDLPMHGARNNEPTESMQFLRHWQEFWAGNGRAQLLSEWQTLMNYANNQFPGLPLGYFGLSLGTQYGILLLSQTALLKAAVLGLFGSRPLPASKVMNACAPKIEIPIYFIQKQHDELHPRTTSSHLYDSLGSSDKIMDSTPGKHAEVSEESLSQACQFISQHIIK